MKNAFEKRWVCGQAAEVTASENATLECARLRELACSYRKVAETHP